jgi:hypothetical protein
LTELTNDKGRKDKKKEKKTDGLGRRESKYGIKRAEERRETANSSKLVAGFSMYTHLIR